MITWHDCMACPQLICCVVKQGGLNIPTMAGRSSSSGPSCGHRLAASHSPHLEEGLLAQSLEHHMPAFGEPIIPLLYSQESSARRPTNVKGREILARDDRSACVVLHWWCQLCCGLAQPVMPGSPWAQQVLDVPNGAPSALNNLAPQAVLVVQQPDPMCCKPVLQACAACCCEVFGQM